MPHGYLDSLAFTHTIEEGCVALAMHCIIEGREMGTRCTQITSTTVKMSI